MNVCNSVGTTVRRLIAIVWVLTDLPPGKVDANADAAPVGATNREMRRPSLDTLEGFFYV